MIELDEEDDAISKQVRRTGMSDEALGPSQGVGREQRRLDRAGDPSAGEG